MRTEKVEIASGYEKAHYPCLGMTSADYIPIVELGESYELSMTVKMMFKGGEGESVYAFSNAGTHDKVCLRDHLDTGESRECTVKVKAMDALPMYL